MMKWVLLVVLVLLTVRPVRAEDQPFYQASVIAALAAHGADLASTEHCLGAGRCQELNPYFFHFSDQPVVFGALKMAGAGLGVWAASKIPNKTVATLVNFSIAGVFTFVAYHNTQVLR